MVIFKENVKEGIAVTVVMYPATSISGGRCRLCINPNFSDDDISKLIAATMKVGNELNIFYNKK